MKKLVDFNQLLSEAEESYRKKQGQTKNQKEEHELFAILDSTIQASVPEQPEATILSYTNVTQLEPREIYTLKKKILDHLANFIFGYSNFNFFDHAIVLKLNQASTHRFKNHLKPEQQAYVFFNSKIISTLKFTKNSQILDPVDGSVYTLNSFYQNLDKRYFYCEMEGKPYYVELPLSYGIVVLDKTTPHALEPELE